LYLVEVEMAFKTVKDELEVQPINHHPGRIEAHHFIAVIDYRL
jgi:hypothetical protein